MNATADLAFTPACPSREQRRALFAETTAPAPAGNATEFRRGMHAPDLEQDLAKNQLLALPRKNLTLTCLAGELWLTRDGDREDYILGPGRSFAIRRGDGTVVHALRPSRVRLTAP